VAVEQRIGGARAILPPAVGERLAEDVSAPRDTTGTADVTARTTGAVDGRSSAWSRLSAPVDTATTRSAPVAGPMPCSTITAPAG